MSARRRCRVDGVTTAHDLPEVLTADLAVTRELGFGGKLCIHPRQVDAVNVALAPSDPEIAWARRILAASPSAGGRGVCWAHDRRPGHRSRKGVAGEGEALTRRSRDISGLPYLLQIRFWADGHATTYAPQRRALAAGPR